LGLVGSSIIAGVWLEGFSGRGQRAVINANSSEVSKKPLSIIAVEEAERIVGLGEGRARSAGDKCSVSGCR
jgi:hypothetical protein